MLYTDEGDAAGETQRRLCLDSSRICESADQRSETPAVSDRVIIAIEVIGGIALILGVYSRIAALALIPGMVGAIVTVHGGAGFFFNNPNGGWEIVGLVVAALLGDGAYALRTTFTAPTPA
jgi:uncharacterized membrane protein YphA (DoxX/SURF4 family)